ncbi:MAG: XisI protein [Microcoleaceae cyanobacterium]
MDTLENYREIIKKVLQENADFYSYDEIECKPIYDEKKDTYLLITIGWDRGKRIHSCFVHLDIINNKVWVQRDDTEDGVTPELVEAGIPKNCIVLGFHPPDVRPHTGFATA